MLARESRFSHLKSIVIKLGLLESDEVVHFEPRVVFYSLLFFCVIFEFFPRHKFNRNELFVL